MPFQNFGRTPAYRAPGGKGFSLFIAVLLEDWEVDTTGTSDEKLTEFWEPPAAGTPTLELAETWAFPAAGTPTLEHFEDWEPLDGPGDVSDVALYLIADDLLV